MKKLLFPCLILAMPHLSFSGNPPADRLQVAITVEEHSGNAVSDQFVRRGVPFAAGTVRSVDGLRLRDGQGQDLPVQAEAMKRHRDGSVEWASVAFLPSLGPRQSRSYILHANGEAALPEGPNRVQVERLNGGAVLQNGLVAVTFGPAGIAAIRHRDRDALTAAGATLQVVTGDGETHTFQGREIDILAQGPVYATVRMTGMLHPLGMEAEWAVTLASDTQRIEQEFRFISKSDVILHSAGLMLNLPPESAPAEAVDGKVLSHPVLRLGAGGAAAGLLLHAPDVARFHGAVRRTDNQEAPANGFVLDAGPETLRLFYAPIQLDAPWTWYDGVSRTSRLSVVFGEDAVAAMPPAAFIDPAQFVASGVLATAHRPPSAQRAIEWVMGALDLRDGRFEAGAIPQQMAHREDGSIAVGSIGSRPGETVYNLWYAQMQNGDPQLHRMLVEEAEVWADVVVYRGQIEFLNGANRYGSVDQYGTHRSLTSHPYYGDPSGQYLTYLMTGNPYFRETFQRMVDHSVAAARRYPTYGGFLVPRRFNWPDGNLRPLPFIESRNMMQARGLSYAEQLFGDPGYGEIAAQTAAWAHHVQHQTGLWYQAYYDHGGPLTQRALDLPSAKNYIMLYGFRGIVAFHDHLIARGDDSSEAGEIAQTILLKFADYLVHEQQEDGWLWDPISDGGDFAANLNEDMRRGQMPRQEIMAIEVLDAAYRNTGDDRYLASMLEMLRYFLAVQQKHGGWSSRNQHRNHEDGTVQDAYLGNKLAQFLRILPRLQVSLAREREKIEALGFRDLLAVLSPEARDARDQLEHDFDDREVGFNVFDTPSGRVLYLANFSGWRSGEWTKQVDLKVDDTPRLYEGAVNRIDSSGTRVQGELHQFARLYAHALPIILEATDEVEAEVTHHRPDWLGLRLTGNGRIDLTIADGLFSIRDGATYQVELNGRQVHEAQPEGELLKLTLEMREAGPVEILVRPAAN